VLSGVLAGEASARAPDRRTGNYHSHIVLVCQENQRALAVNHESVAHICLTASEEYVVFILIEIRVNYDIEKNHILLTTFNNTLVDSQHFSEIRKKNSKCFIKIIQK
jgi:hypothetical protein